MAAAPLQNLKLIHGWALGDEPWGDQMNQNLRSLDVLAQGRCLDVEDTPPGSPDEGDAYIVGASATGLWDGHDNDIARWTDNTSEWEFYTPLAGWRMWVDSLADQLLFDGTDWTLAGSLLGGLSMAMDTVFGSTRGSILYRGASVWALRTPGTAGYFLQSQGAGADPVYASVSSTVPVLIELTCSDEITALSTGAAKITFRTPYAFTLTAVRASLNVAQASGSALVVDINESGSSILSTKLTFDNTEKTTVSASTPAVISDTSIADDAEITVDIDTVGDGTAVGLKVCLIGTRPFAAPTPYEIQFACSDEITALTAGTGKVTIRLRQAMTLTGVRASLTTAQATDGAGGIFTVDINESGSSILSTKLTIDNTEKTSVTAATAAVISDTSLADDAEITIDIDQIGDGTATGLKVTLIGTI